MQKGNNKTQFQDGWYYRQLATGDWVRCDSLSQVLAHLERTKEPPRLVEGGVMLDVETSWMRAQVELDRQTVKLKATYFALQAVNFLIFPGIFFMLWRLCGFRSAVMWLGIVFFLLALRSFVDESKTRN